LSTEICCDVAKACVSCSYGRSIAAGSFIHPMIGVRSANPSANIF
jgi:hypothetical protein